MAARGTEGGSLVAAMLLDSHIPMLLLPPLAPPCALRASLVGAWSTAREGGEPWRCSLPKGRGVAGARTPDQACTRTATKVLHQLRKHMAVRPPATAPALGAAPPRLFAPPPAPTTACPSLISVKDAGLTHPRAGLRGPPPAEPFSMPQGWELSLCPRRRYTTAWQAVHHCLAGVPGSAPVHGTLRSRAVAAHGTSISPVL